MEAILSIMSSPISTSRPILSSAPSRDHQDKQESRNRLAVAYVRVSTDHQLKGVGPDRQIAAINTYAKQAGFFLVKIIEESHTATDSAPLQERPGFAEAVSKAFGLRCPILVETMDRVSRNERVFGEWRARSDVRIIPVCEQDRYDTAGERARVAAASVIAEERAAKQAAAFERMRAEGKRLGNPNPSALAHQRSVARRQAFAAQRLEKIIAVLDEMGLQTSRPDLASELNRRGIMTSQGLEWTPNRLTPHHKEALSHIRGRSNVKEGDKAGLSLDEAEMAELRKDPRFGMF